MDGFRYEFQFNIFQAFLDWNFIFGNIAHGNDILPAMSNYRALCHLEWTINLNSFYCQALVYYS